MDINMDYYFFLILVKHSDLSFPKEYGLGYIKGLLGQRKYK